MLDIKFTCTEIPGNQPCLMAVDGESVHVWIDYDAMERLGIGGHDRMEMLNALFSGLGPGKRAACVDELSVQRARNAATTTQRQTIVSRSG